MIFIGKQIRISLNDIDDNIGSENTDLKNTDSKNTDLDMERPMTRRNKNESVSTSSVHKVDDNYIDDSVNVDLEQRVNIINISEPKNNPSNNPEPDYKTDPDDPDTSDADTRPVLPPPKITPLTHILDTNMVKSYVANAKDLKTISQKEMKEHHNNNDNGNNDSNNGNKNNDDDNATISNDNKDKNDNDKNDNDKTNSKQIVGILDIHEGNISEISPEIHQAEKIVNEGSYMDDLDISVSSVSPNIRVSDKSNIHVTDKLIENYNGKDDGDDLKGDDVRVAQPPDNRYIYICIYIYVYIQIYIYMKSCVKLFSYMYISTCI
jgi:hypothetical protein